MPPLPWSAVLAVVGAVSLTGDGERPGESAALVSPEGLVSFDRDVRPILSENCFVCHGPDAGTREADLRLDHRAGVLGVAEELLARITTDDRGDRMPPPSTHKSLDAGQVDTLRRWLAAGAPWTEHWSFVPPQRPTPPALPDPSWARNPIDQFIGAELAERGLEPSPQAAAEALLRRSFLELTGLPPTLAEQEQFRTDVAATDVDRALDQWILRLTEQEPYLTRYAEHRARPWLDQARYADTAGIHMDAGWQAWAWRDWVIEALRENKPFDQFAVEQLAGDLLPDADVETQVASGFHRLHVVTDEGGAIDEEYLVEYAVDRVATTGAVFLGLTLGCARCHDHKYDPWSMEDFYGLYAFFDSIDQPGLYSQLPDANRAFEPFLELPSPTSDAELQRIDRELAALEAERGPWTAEERALWAGFEAEWGTAVHWEPSAVLAAESAGGAQATVEADGSVRFHGDEPDQDRRTLTLRTGGAALDTLLLEVLPEDGPGGSGPIGRASNGNAVLRLLTVEARAAGSDEPWAAVPLDWIAASHEQADGDFAAVEALDDGDTVWALDGHRQPGPRWALVTFATAVGFPGGTEWRVTLDHRSPYARHSFARPRLWFGALAPGARGRLPVATGRMQRSSGFAFGETERGYTTAFAPERETYLRRGQELPVDEIDPAAGTWRWEFDEAALDGALLVLPGGGRGVTYVGRELRLPSARSLDFSLGSDDGLVLLLDGRPVFERRIDRSLAADQDRTVIEVPAGRHLLLQKVINTAGDAGAFQRLTDAPEALPRQLLPLAFPAASQAEQRTDLAEAWRSARSPRQAEWAAREAALEARRAAVLASLPRAMVMRERAERRPTYVLTRGDYRHPDRERPVDRAVPALLGGLPQGAPRDRLGLARWLVAPENPLTARVTVNRLWAQVFGTGLVATTEDFGVQGERPSHPHLLDWLAVEFTDSGYDLRHLMRLLLESRTYRQSSDWRAELAAVDPDDRLLGRHPRRRLSAEELRDNALALAGLLVERRGGPSVKPYQPPGLWEEVAMPQSNTRQYRRGEGEDLWRRSLYTYWKRAAPPPSMVAFDAPTREVCVVERAATDTPLQALVLWNDEQFVEAARELAERNLLELEPAAEIERAGLATLFQRVLARAPEPAELEALERTLEHFLARYAAAPEEAAALLEVGESYADPRLPAPELAAWTLVASALLNLFETTNPR
jgi:mono/diheme cytochrome c family protein